MAESTQGCRSGGVLVVDESKLRLNVVPAPQEEGSAGVPVLGARLPLAPPPQARGQ